MNFKTILVYIWRGWFLVLATVLTLVLGFFIYLLSIKDKYSALCYKFIRLWCFGMFYGMGFRYEFIKKTSKNVDERKQYIIISNHTSMMDIMLPCILHSDHVLCFVGKKELEKIPIFGSIYKRLFISVDRKDPNSRAEVYVKCAEQIKKGKSIVIFPEGGVPDDTSIILDNFKNGAFSMAIEHKVDVVVYTFLGLKEMFPFDNSKGYPGKVRVYLNDILEPNDTDIEILKEKARKEILETIEKYNYEK